MEPLGEVSLESLEARAKLQVKVHRTVLRQQLIMVGNALLIAFAFAAALLLLWTILTLFGVTNELLGVYAPLLGLSARRLLQLSTVGLVGFKLGALLLLLCPGLGFRLAGNALEP